MTFANIIASIEPLDEAAMAKARLRPTKNTFTVAVPICRCLKQGKKNYANLSMT